MSSWERCVHTLAREGGGEFVASLPLRERGWGEGERRNICVSPMLFMLETIVFRPKLLLAARRVGALGIQ